MNAYNEKQINVQTMLKTLGSLFNEISDSKVKQEYSSFLFLLTRADGKTPSLNTLLDIIDKNIKSPKQSRNTIVGGMTNESIVSFWVKVRNIIVETYNKNKDL